jgi:deoxyribodipyrimidine photo-lyase
VALVHEPWKLEPLWQEGVDWRLGRDYPAPIVDPAATARAARDRIHARRREQGFGALADAIQERHGSRRSGLAPSGARRRKRSNVNAVDVDQLALDLG